MTGGAIPGRLLPWAAMDDVSAARPGRHVAEQRLGHRRSALDEAVDVEKRRARLAVAAVIVALSMAAAAAARTFSRADVAFVAATAIAAIAFRRRVVATRRRKRVGYTVDWLDRAARQADDPSSTGQSNGSTFADPRHLHAVDLDLFGEGSLYHRLNHCHTPFGQRALAATITADPTGALDVVARQRAVAVLVDDPEGRERIEVALREWLALAPASSVLRERLMRRTLELAQLGDEAPAPDATPSTAALLLLATIVTTLGLAAATGALPLWPFAVGYLVNLAVIRRDAALDPLMERFEQVDRTLDAWAGIFAAVEQLSGRAGELESIRAELVDSSGTPASDAIRDLHRRVHRLSQRRNVLHALTVDVVWLTSLHAKRSVQEWRRRHGGDIGRWFHAAARAEALAACAAYADHAEGCAWPELVERAGADFDATGLTHPLLPRDVRVGNDCTLSGTGALWVVTGSNMSGKSTFLRSVGLAAVMANAGLPVAAERLRVPSRRVLASMRVADSVRDGTSLFQAEARRLRRCLEVAETGGQTLVLLDEILAGTNSRERHLGAAAVLRRLARTDAMVLISTHDLDLATRVGELHKNPRVVHFRDHVVDGRMAFDYQCRPGPLKSTNALAVLRAEGVLDGVDPDPERGDRDDDVPA